MKKLILLFVILLVCCKKPTQRGAYTGDIYKNGKYIPSKCKPNEMPCTKR